MMNNYKHVILVVIDGAGSFTRFANVPTIRRMMGEGAGTEMCLTSIPIDSTQRWGSMLMGVSSRLHGLHNGKISDALPAPPTSTPPCSV